MVIVADDFMKGYTRTLIDFHSEAAEEGVR
jgi:hypothetical protein